MSLSWVMGAVSLLLEGRVIATARQKVIRPLNLGCKSSCNTHTYLLAPPLYSALYRIYTTSYINYALFHFNSVGHSVILAHAHAVKAYREDFKPEQKGEIGITLNGDWAMPYDDSPESEPLPFYLPSIHPNPRFFRPSFKMKRTSRLITHLSFA